MQFICEKCGKEFRAKAGRNAKYCSHACRMAAYRGVTPQRVTIARLKAKIEALQTGSYASHNVTDEDGDENVIDSVTDSMRPQDDPSRMSEEEFDRRRAAIDEEFGPQPDPDERCDDFIGPDCHGS